jgi:hypothetical protein
VVVEDDAGSTLSERSIGLLRVGLIAALALPVVWIVLTRDDHNIGDVALLELRIRDVFSSHPPLTGAYSRYGWSHPGPLMFYLFAVPYRLFGNDANALRVATMLFNLIALGLLLWLAHRRGRAPLVAVATAATLLIWGLQADALSYGWNVTVTVVPFMLTAVACWSVLRGDHRALIAAAVSAVFVFETHVGVGVVIAPLVVITFGHAAWRGLTPHVGRWTLAVGGGVLAVALVPLLVDLFRDPPGNTGRILKWSLTNDEPKVGVEDGLRMIGRTSSLSFLWHPELPGRFLLQIETVAGGVLPGIALLLLGLALVQAIRSQWYDEATFCGVVAVLWASGVVAASTITEPLGWWLVEWLQPLGWLTWAAIALVGWRVIQRRWRGPTGQIDRGALMAAGLLVTVAAGAHALDTFELDDRSAEVVEPVTKLTDAALSAPRSGVIRIDFIGSPLTAETMLSGVVNRLDAEGVEVCVDESLAYKFGSFRVCSAEPTSRLIIRSEPTALAPPERSETLAISDPLTEQERLEADGLRARIAAVLERSGRSEQVGVLDTPLADTVLLGEPPTDLVAIADDVRRLDELRDVAGIRYGLYLVSG